MGCSVRTNRHGYLAFRLYFQGLESHEGTKLRDTPANRAKVEARAQVIEQEIREGVFDYLRWFPDGNLASRFRPASELVAGQPITVRGFFSKWKRGGEASRIVRSKWQRNRESYLRAHVLPELGTVRLDQLQPRHITELQDQLRKKGLAAGPIDRVIHSAFRGMLRDAELSGYRSADLRVVFDRRFVGRLDKASDAAEIDPFTDDEREKILGSFFESQPRYHTFVYFRFWTGTRPSEAIALWWGDIDLPGCRVRIRRSRVLGKDGRPKTGRSKRDVIVHEGLDEILRRHAPEQPDPKGFVFMTPTGAPIDEANFVRRVWIPALRKLKIRERPFYNTRHTYISTLLAIGAKPLFVCRQTRTSLEMIERHYGDARMSAQDLDEMMGDSKRSTRNLDGRRRRLRHRERTKPRLLEALEESGRPGSNRRRPAWGTDWGGGGEARMTRVFEEFGRVNLRRPLR